MLEIKSRKEACGSERHLNGLRASSDARGLGLTPGTARPSREPTKSHPQAHYREQSSYTRAGCGPKTKQKARKESVSKNISSSFNRVRKRLKEGDGTSWAGAVHLSGTQKPIKQKLLFHDSTPEEKLPFGPEWGVLWGGPGVGAGVVTNNSWPTSPVAQYTGSRTWCCSGPEVLGVTQVTVQSAGRPPGHHTNLAVLVTALRQASTLASALSGSKGETWVSPPGVAVLTGLQKEEGCREKQRGHWRQSQEVWVLFSHFLRTTEEGALAPYKPQDFFDPSLASESTGKLISLKNE